jgi:hypothetical protein
MEEKLYCGSAKQRNENFTSIALNLSKIPKEHIFEFNGDKYIKLTLGKKESVDKNGKTHWLAVDTWKPGDKSDSGQKQSAPKPYPQPQEKPQPKPVDKYDEPNDDLPF